MKLKKILFMSFFLFYHAIFALADEPEQKFQGFNLQGYKESGDKAWDVNGETADIVGSKVKLTNVVANSYGQEQVNVTAQTGTIDQVSGQMLLEKDVVITSQQGVQLLTDSLQWDRKEDLVSTEDDVVIMDEGMTVTGTGINAKPGLKEAEIKQDVTVRVEPKTEGKQAETVTITSDGPLEIDQAKSRAVFNDNVVAIQLDRTLKADRMEVYFNEKNNQIEKIICIGNVVIEQGENRTYAQRAYYNAADKRLVLSGKPKLILLTEGDSVFTAPGN